MNMAETALKRPAVMILLTIVLAGLGIFSYFHLGKLESTGIVDSRKEGRNVIYSITEMGRSLSGPLR